MKRSQLSNVAVGLLGGLVVAVLIVRTSLYLPQLSPGIDWLIYKDAALSWASGDGFYHGYQLAGPYEVRPPAVLYPPTVIPLLLVFAHLPDLLWWIIPCWVIVSAIWYHRPGKWALLVILMCLTSRFALWVLVHGTPTMWIGAAIAVGTIWRPAFSLVLLKPSVFPFALFGVRSRGWWAMVGVLILATLPFLGMIPDYATVLLNSRGAGLLYSAPEFPFLLIPLVAWAGGRHPPVTWRRGRIGLNQSKDRPPEVPSLL
jgi:hypothetical protein